MNTPETKLDVVPLTVVPVRVVKPAALPVIVAPERRVVNTPDAPLYVTNVAVVPVAVEVLKIEIFPDAYSTVLPVRVVIVALSFVSAANNPEFPVIVAPKRRVEKTPDTKFAVVPLVVVPVKDVNPPEVKAAVVPVVVVPESTE